MTENYENCILKYKEYHATLLAEDMLFYKEQPSLYEAIVRAMSFKEKSGKHYSHQRRINKDAQKSMRHKLVADLNTIERQNSFHNLHAFIQSKTAPITGIGPLTIYDVSLRIGAYLNLEPELIYVHAGAMDGAKSLGLSGETLQINALPKAFQKLSPSEIEACLCIHKDCFKKGSSICSTDNGGCGSQNTRGC